MSHVRAGFTSVQKLQKASYGIPSLGSFTLPLLLNADGLLHRVVQVPLRWPISMTANYRYRSIQSSGN